MGERSKISATTIRAVASENAGHPLDAERAQDYVQVFEPILEKMVALRQLPLKDIEPAVIFQPVETTKAAGPPSDGSRP